MSVENLSRATEDELMRMHKERAERYWSASRRIRGILLAAASMGDDEACEDYAAAITLLEREGANRARWVDAIARDKQKKAENNG
jgi:hypothetical protein